MAYSERLLKAIASGKGVIKERTPEEQIAEQIDILWSLLKVVERRTCYIYCETDKQVEAIISAVGEIGIRVDVGDEKFVATLPDSLEETQWRGMFFQDEEPFPEFFPRPGDHKMIVFDNFEKASPKAIWAVFHMGNSGGVRVNDELILMRDRIPMGNGIILLSKTQLETMIAHYDDIYPAWRYQVFKDTTYNLLAGLER